jgi:hypothetical protein
MLLYLVKCSKAFLTSTEEEVEMTSRKDPKGMIKKKEGRKIIKIETWNSRNNSRKDNNNNPLNKLFYFILSPLHNSRNNSKDNNNPLNKLFYFY